MCLTPKFDSFSHCFGLKHWNCFFSNSSGKLRIVVNDEEVFNLKIGKKEESALKYLSFASGEIGRYEEFFYDCDPSINLFWSSDFLIHTLILILTFLMKRLQITWNQNKIYGTEMCHGESYLSCYVFLCSWNKKLKLYFFTEKRCLLITINRFQYRNWILLLSVELDRFILHELFRLSVTRNRRNIPLRLILLKQSLGKIRRFELCLWNRSIASLITLFSWAVSFHSIFSCELFLTVDVLS